MSLLDRNITIGINWFLDNLIPPVLHDCSVFMKLIIWPAYGQKTKYLLDFKNEYPRLSDVEINSYYELIADVPINKKRITDLNKKCIQYITNNIEGNSVLDAACGRGFMLSHLFNKFDNNLKITGCDIVLPKYTLPEDIQLVQGNLTQLPFLDNEFDTVICTHALEHIRQYKKAIKELIRVSAKKVIIVVPCQREYKYTVDLHVNFCPYMYRFQEFIGIPDASYYKISGDFVCIIEKSDLALDLEG